MNEVRVPRITAFRLPLGFSFDLCYAEVSRVRANKSLIKTFILADLGLYYMASLALRRILKIIYWLQFVFLALVRKTSSRSCCKYPPNRSTSCCSWDMGRPNQIKMLALLRSRISNPGVSCLPVGQSRQIRIIRHPTARPQEFPNPSISFDVLSVPRMACLLLEHSLAFSDTRS
jgi:hypothetical protein